MSANHHSPPKERIKLVEPPLQLRQPPPPGSGLKQAAALVLFAVLLLWLFSGGDGSPKPIQPSSQGGSSPRQIQLSPQGNATAVDQVEQLTKELSERARETESATMKKMAGGGDQLLILNGVQFRITVPTGWTVSEAGRQSFVKKSGDARICQLTADKNFDTKGMITDVKGKEVEFEARYMKEALGMAVPSEVRIEVRGDLLQSSYNSDLIKYTVRTRATIKAGNKSIEQGGINTTVAASKLMVRLQCMNTSGTSDQDGSMESMGRSLKLLVTSPQSL